MRIMEIRLLLDLKFQGSLNSAWADLSASKMVAPISVEASVEVFVIFDNVLPMVNEK